MKMKLFYTDKKGYVTAIDNVKKIKIMKLNGKNHLKINYNFDDIIIEKLTDVEVAYLIDIDTMQELFRYEK